jgi:hypothetical protein
VATDERGLIEVRADLLVDESWLEVIGARPTFIR